MIISEQQDNRLHRQYIVYVGDIQNTLQNSRGTVLLKLSLTPSTGNFLSFKLFSEYKHHVKSQYIITSARL